MQQIVVQIIISLYCANIVVHIKQTKYHSSEKNLILTNCFPIWICALFLITVYRCKVMVFTSITDLWFPQQREVRLLNVPLRQLSKITNCSVKFLGKNSRIFISKDDKIVYNYFFGKSKMLLNHGFPRSIFSTKHPLLRSRCFVDKIVLGNPW